MVPVYKNIVASISIVVFFMGVEQIRGSLTVLQVIAHCTGAKPSSQSCIMKKEDFCNYKFKHVPEPPYIIPDITCKATFKDCIQLKQVVVYNNTELQLNIGCVTKPKKNPKRWMNNRTHSKKQKNKLRP